MLGNEKSGVTADSRDGWRQTEFDNGIMDVYHWDARAFFVTYEL